MTDSDLMPFMSIFNTLTKVFPFRADGDEARDISRAYFKTLQKFPLDLVKIGADNCVATMTKFPKPAEWAKSIPRRLPGPDLPRLTPAEESEWRHAESLGFEGECCQCADCVALGANQLPTRYVPLDSEERATMGDRVVLRGEWIHGESLISWHLVRENFWTTFKESRVGQSMAAPKMIEKMTAQERVEAIFATKKPRKEWMPYRDAGEES